MSYLDVPRLHFSGEFFSDPSTLNNSVANHNNAAPLPPGVQGWSPNGRHHFQLRGCVVRSAVDASGTALSAPAQDTLIQGSVASTDGTGVARLVDLDPQHQIGSQIWGLEIRVQDSASQGFTAVMETASLRELWDARAPGNFSMGLGGTYQSVLTPVTWTPASGPMQSALLQALRTASPNRLSIRLVCWRYDSSSGPTFGFGQIVGTIGPSAASEPARFIADRRLVHAGADFGVASINSAAYNTAPFKVDASRRRLVIDLGNALPEEASGDRRAIGPLRAEIVNTGANPARVLGSGPIPNATADLRRNAGVEEIALTQAQVTALATRPLRVKAGPDLVLTERPSGIHVDVSDTVVRLNWLGTTADIELFASQMGRPMANANVHIARSVTRPQALTGFSVRTGPPAFSTTLTLPGVVRTNSSGRVVLRLVGGDPGHPRPHVDGQVSFLGFYVGSAPTVAAQRGEIAIRVFDRQLMPTVLPPTFSNVQPILEQYFRLYPAMRQPTAAKQFGFVDLNNLAQVQPVAPVLAASLRRAETAGNYMPVTRDLSMDKKTLLLAWLDAGAPA